MKSITVTLSDKAYDFLEQEATAKEQTLQDIINKKFSFYEENKDNQEKIDHHLNTIRQSVISHKADEVYKKHPLQEYILEYYPNSKQPKKTVCWRTCPIQPDTITYKDHIGEYWVEVRQYEKHSILGLRHIKSSKTYHRKTLKSLKRKVNDIMGYNHYKVKQ